MQVMKHAMVHVSGLRFYSWLSLVPNPHDKGGFRTSHGLRGEYCTIFEFIIICSILSFEANLQSLKVWVFIARSQFVFPFQVWLHFLFRLCFKCFSISLTAVGTSKSAPFHDRENWPKHRGFKLVTCQNRPSCSPPPILLGSVGHFCPTIFSFTLSSDMFYESLYWI